MYLGKADLVNALASDGHLTREEALEELDKETGKLIAARTLAQDARRRPGRSSILEEVSICFLCGAVIAAPEAVRGHGGQDRRGKTRLLSAPMRSRRDLIDVAGLAVWNSMSSSCDRPKTAAVMSGGIRL